MNTSQFQITGSLNPELRVYLIKFRGITTNGKFLVQADELAQVIKTYNRYGIDYIKEFDYNAEKFTKLTRKKIDLYFSFETKIIEELKKVGFIK